MVVRQMLILSSFQDMSVGLDGIGIGRLLRLVPKKSNGFRIITASTNVDIIKY
jgi:hypothetical protein